MPAADTTTESKMLDSIKQTLTRVLGPESTQALEFYIDKHLAVKDPAAFSQALTDFLGSDAGKILIDAIKEDLQTRHSNSAPEPVSKFLKTPTPSRKTQPVPVKRLMPEEKAVTESGSLDFFLRTMNQASKGGISFEDLVTRRLIATKGETCAYATLACLGKGAMSDPKAFARRVSLLFSSDGAALLEELATFVETKPSA